VPAAEALEAVIGRDGFFPAGMRPLYRRLFAEAGL
jgi:hypothetical protein